MSYGLFLYHLNSVTTRQICLPRREMGFIHACDAELGPSRSILTEYSPNKEAGTLRFRPQFY
jgi:hypothetical protein